MDVISKKAVIQSNGAISKAPVTQPVLGNEAAIVAALNNINNSVKGVNDVDRGVMQEINAKPRQTIITIASATGAGAASITQQLFNNDYLTALIINNGSGAASVVNTWNDGFAGALISRVISAKGDAGLRAKQLQLKYVITATGVQDSGGVTAANPTLTTFNGDGSTLPQIIPIASAGTPAYQQQGFLIVNVNFAVKRYSQLSVVVPVGDTVTVTVVWE